MDLILILRRWVDSLFNELKDSNTGQIVLSAGFSENLESGDFL